MINSEFDNKYVELEQILRRITELPDWAGVVALYERTIPSDRATSIETLRKYRNNVIGHGAKVGGLTPTVPQTWIDCLNEEILYVNNNEGKVANEVITVFKKLNRLSFPSALERIFNNRKTDEEMDDSFLVYSKLLDICGSANKNKKTILYYFEIDKILHFFKSVMKEGKNLYSNYNEVKGIVEKRDFDFIVKVVEDLVNKELEESNRMNESLAKEIKQEKNVKEINLAERDPLYLECLKLAIREAKTLHIISETAVQRTIVQNIFRISTIQRELEIGYPRASKIMEQMEQDGFIKRSFENDKITNVVLITEQEYNKRFGEIH